MKLYSLTAMTFSSLLALGLGGCASTDSQARSEALTAEADAVLAQYTLTGETQACIGLSRIDQIEPLDATRWLVTTRSGDAFLNEVSRGCSSATSSFTRLQYRTSLNRLCRNEIVRVIDNGTQQDEGACSLGTFQALEANTER